MILPVKLAASDVWKDAYDMRKNSAVSSIGKSRIFVYLVSNAVTIPNTEPIKNDPPKMPTKFPRALKNALALKPITFCFSYASTELQIDKSIRLKSGHCHYTFVNLHI